MKLKATLTRKVGPLPLWSYLLAVVVLVWWFWIRGRTTQEAPPGAVQLVTGGGSVGPREAAGVGTPGENGAPASMLSPDVLQALISLRGLEFEREYQLANLNLMGRGQDQDYAIRQAELNAASGANTTSTTSTQQPRPPVAQPGYTFAWGGKNWSSNQRGAFDKYLRDKGNPGGVSSWIANHPAAAQRLGWR